jgi:phospholipid/cholesterol/gamma-HCH transport system substrate-binding protein
MNDAGGVRRGDPVQMRGVIVGRVSGFEMTPQGRVDIQLEIEPGWQIPRDSRVQLAGAGLFGGRTVSIMPGSGPLAQNGDTLPSLESSGGDIMGAAGDLADQAGDLVDRLGSLLDTGTVSSVQGTTREVLGLAREFRAVVAEQKDEISRLTASLNRTATGLEDVGSAGEGVASSVARADSLLASLGATSQRLDKVLGDLDTVIGRMARGEGTLGRLSQDPSLYQNLDSAVVSLNALLVDVRENPKRYVTIEIF